MNRNIDLLSNKSLINQGKGYVRFLDQINTKQGLIYVKEFYIVVPYYPAEEDTKNMRKPRWRKFLDALSSADTPEKIVDRYRLFLQNDKYLDTRSNIIMEGLKGMGMYGERLGLSDLISLYFRVYNPESHKDQSVWND